MDALLAQAISFLKGLLPALAALAGGVLMLLLSRKNRELEKAHAELFEEKAQLSDEKENAELSKLQTKVEADDKDVENKGRSLDAELDAYERSAK